MKKIKIELIHDVVCSWCPIGYSHVQKALKEFESQIEADFRFLPYELNPNMPGEGEPIANNLQRKNNWTKQELMKYRETLIEKAAQAGLDYDFSKRTHYWNSASAHAMIHLAESFNKQKEVNLMLIHRYFTEGHNIGDVEVLSDIAKSVGLDGKKIVSELSSPKTMAELEQKSALVQSYNMSSVPTFVFNGGDIVAGSKSVDYFVQYFSDHLNRVVA